ncbi:hypothetical protein KUTeg_024345 [Tegillarca granosa]|uniref:Uncharacterized protein n=1 Tax=Tegillarca granosa TaxID=220873 RepID=A0ABQ9DX23_TEGGR|nr:hypothetical protein KUTeg_024345 [Tegillarca granosa]
MATPSDHKILDGKVAIVTGASSGIGKAIACALARSGAKVALAARRVERLQEMQKDIEKDDGIAIALKTDVTKREEVKEMVKHTESVLGPVDIIVNNAGIMYYTMMKNLHEDEWEKQIDINIKGLTNCIGAVLTGMIDRKCGHIVNLSSDAGRRARDAYDGSSSCKILEPEDIANAVVYTVSQPEYVGVNEILVEPREGCV